MKNDLEYSDQEIIDQTGKKKQNSSSVPGCWPLFLLPFACVGTLIVLQGFSVLSYVWSHPNVDSSVRGYYRLGHYYYQVPQALPADPQTLEFVRSTLVFSGIIYAIFALALLVVWLVILTWFISLFTTPTAKADQSFLPKQPKYDETFAADYDAEQAQYITFTWREQQYMVDLAVYLEEKKILLPDKTLLRPESGWLDVWPPVPNGLVAVPYEHQQEESFMDLVERLNACAAWEDNAAMST